MCKLQNRLVWRVHAFVEGNPGNGSACTVPCRAERDGQCLELRRPLQSSDAVV